MFQITRRADYAVRTLLALGEHPVGEWVAAARIAREMGIPLPFLRQIGGDLVQAGMVKTRPGPTGGLALARPAEEINLLQVLEAVEGPICLNVCLLRPAECPRDLICPAHTFWGRLQASIIRQLQDATLDRLAAEAAELKRRPHGRDVLTLARLPDSAPLQSPTPQGIPQWTQSP